MRPGMESDTCMEVQSSEEQSAQRSTGNAGEVNCAATAGNRSLRIHDQIVVKVDEKRTGISE